MKHHGPDLVGRPAGIATRSGAYILDIVIAFVSYAIGLALCEFAWNLIVEDTIGLNGGAVRTEFWSLAFLIYWIIYLWYWWALDGRSPGKALCGLRLIRRDGGPVHRLTALGRAILYVILPPPFFSWPFVLLRRDRRGLHDLVFSTRVVYDWGTRPVRPRPPRRLRVAAAPAAEPIVTAIPPSASVGPAELSASD